MTGKLKIKILFVCTLNQMRSRTAEELYKEDERFIVKSGGVDDEAVVQVNLESLEWADYVVVMEEMHRNWIRSCYPLIYGNKKVLNLDIPDIFYFEQPELVSQVKNKFETLYQKEMKNNS